MEDKHIANLYAAAIYTCVFNIYAAKYPTNDGKTTAIDLSILPNHR
jgi:hypothetical protein